jgi:AcrR family transcriptional regulator
MAAARRLFAERGYADVPTDEIVAAASLTRGALYHHFADKRALFESVFLELEAEITAEIAAAGSSGTGWPAITAALSTFLDLCLRPEVVQIALTDAPAVLGWARWREIEAEHGLRLIVDQLQGLADAGELAGGPVELLAQLALSATVEAALVIAHAADPAAARARAEIALLTLLSGLIPRS